MIAAEQNLPRCPLFDSLTPAQRRELLPLLDRESFGSGRTILAEGDSTRNLWIVAEGRCEVVKRLAGGAENRLAELGPGAVFGEMSFFQPAAHSATVRAMTDVVTLRLPFELYKELERTGLRAAYAIAGAIAGTLAERLRRMDRWTSDLLSPHPPGKHEEWADFRSKLYNNWEF